MKTSAASKTPTMPEITDRKILTGSKPLNLSEYGVKLPRSYILELTNYCNLRCSMCNFHSPEVSKRREKGFMPFSVAANLIERISAADQDRPWVALHGAGESLLHKDFLKILAKASLFSNLDAGFLTNAVLLDDEISMKILDTSISWIGFSIDGINREKFNKYRCGAEYERVINNALRFIERARQMNKQIKIIVNMTMQDEMKNDVQDFVNFWIKYVDEVCVSPVRPIGSRDNILARESIAVPRQPCYMLYEMMVILWNGDVALCCEDWFNENRLGNIVDNDFEAIWNGRGFRDIRLLHEAGKFGSIELCKTCNSWHRPAPDIFENETLGYTVTKNAWQYVYKPKLTP